MSAAWWTKSPATISMRSPSPACRASSRAASRYCGEASTRTARRAPPLRSSRSMTRSRHPRRARSSRSRPGPRSCRATCGSCGRDPQRDIWRDRHARIDRRSGWHSRHSRSRPSRQPSIDVSRCADTSSSGRLLTGCRTNDHAALRRSWSPMHPRPVSSQHAARHEASRRGHFADIPVGEAVASGRRPPAHDHPMEDPR